MLTAQNIDKANGSIGWTKKETDAIFLGKNTKLVYQIQKNTNSSYNAKIMQAVDQENYIEPQANADAFAKEVADKLFDHLTPRMMKALLIQLAKELTDEPEKKEAKKNELKSLIDAL